MPNKTILIFYTMRVPSNPKVNYESTQFTKISILNKLLCSVSGEGLFLHWYCKTTVTLEPYKLV